MLPTYYICHLEVASTQEKFDGQGHPHLKRLGKPCSAKTDEFSENFQIGGGGEGVSYQIQYYWIWNELIELI